MDTLSSVVADAFDLLRMDLYRHLDEAEYLVCKNAGWSEEDVEAIGKLIPDLVAVIRELVVEHASQADGECRTCGSTWPCPVVTTIHTLVKDPERQFAVLIRRAEDS